MLPLLVLHLLGDGRSYGNQLIERIAEVSDGLLVVNPNTMYPLLRDLEARGLVAGEWEHPERRSRRFYALTRGGRGRARAPARRRRAAPGRGRARGRAAAGRARLMGRASATITLPGVRIADAEALWYDVTRWPSFVEGFKHVVRDRGRLARGRVAARLAVGAGRPRPRERAR